MTYPSNTNPYEVERLLHHMPSIAVQGQTEFARGVAKSIARQSRRRNWWPSQKQLPLMRELVRDLFATGNEQGDGFDLIES